VEGAGSDDRVTAMPFDEPQTDALNRWLAAERSGLDSDSEAALAELLGGLPRPAPPAGFADRVLARARPRAAAPRAWRWRWVPARGGAVGWAAAATIAALVSLLGLLAARLAPVSSLKPLHPLAPAAVRAMLDAANVAAVLQAGIHTVVALGEWLAATVVFANQLLLLVRAVAEPLATLPVAALTGGCLLVSALALRFLYDLIQRDRRWVYVDPI
jgi:hypothetical protein